MAQAQTRVTDGALRAQAAASLFPERWAGLGSPDNLGSDLPETLPARPGKPSPFGLPRIRASWPVTSFRKGPTLALVGCATFALLVAGEACLVLHDLVIRYGGGETVQLPPALALVLSALFFVYVFTTIFSILLFPIWRAMDRRPALPPAAEHFKPLVSIVIPAYNEEDCIAETIRAAQALDYPHKEIIVVDDGSTDRTRIIAEAFNVAVVGLRQNSGKSAALNKALETATGQIVLFTDSDSYLAPDALTHLVKHFADPKVAAVCGTVQPLAGKGFVGLMQELEYAYSQEILKPAQQASAGVVMVMPGPIAAFRRDVLRQIGGFRTRTLAEDFDASMEILKAGYESRFEPRAVAESEAPKSWAELKAQRIRWCRGTLQVLLANRDMIGSAKFGLIGMFWLPHYLVTGYTMLIFDLLGIFVLLPLLLWFAPFSLSLFVMGAMSFLAIELISGMVQALSMAVVRGPKWFTAFHLFWVGFLTRPYAVFMTGVRILALERELKGASLKW